MAQVYTAIMSQICLQTHFTYGKYACIRFHRLKNILARENLAHTLLVQREQVNFCDTANTAFIFSQR